MRRLLLGGMAALLVLGLTLGLPRTALAHSLRVASDPDAGAVLQQPPATVTITFGEEPDARLSSIDVLDTAGQSHAAGRAQSLPGDATRLRVAVTPLPRGVYTVSWRTLSAVDGHRAAGSYAFGVQVAPGEVTTANAAASTSGDSGRPSALAVAGRWLFYIGLLGLLGAAFTGTVVVAGAPLAVLRMCLVTWPLAAAGAGMVTAVQAHDAGVGWGDLPGSSLGHALAVRGIPLLTTGAALVVAVVLRRRGSASGPRAALAAVAAGAGLSMLGDVLQGHAAAGGAREALNVGLQWVHIVAGGIWIGGLAALLLAVRGTAAEGSARAVRRFSFSAGIALAAVLVTGVVRAAVEIESWGSVLSTDFGRLVVLKLTLIGVLAVLGAVNRWRHVPQAQRRLSGLRRIGSAELGVAGLAILTAAALVNVSPPASAAAAGPGAGQAARPAPLGLDANDYATTVRLHLEVSPGTAGFNTFTARLSGYDSGAPVAASDIQLTFTFPLRNDLGASTLVLKPAASPGTFSATGANLSLDGPWNLSALVEGATPVEIPLHLTTTAAPQKIQVSRAAGQPTISSIALADGTSVQVYLDPEKPGTSEFHVTFFAADGNELPVNDVQIAVTVGDGQPQILTILKVDAGHYGAPLTLAAGRNRFDFSGTIGTAPGTSLIGSHIELAVTP